MGLTRSSSSAGPQFFEGGVIQTAIIGGGNMVAMHLASAVGGNLLLGFLSASGVRHPRGGGGPGANRRVSDLAHDIYWHARHEAKADRPPNCAYRFATGNLGVVPVLLAWPSNEHRTFAGSRLPFGVAASATSVLICRCTGGPHHQGHVPSWAATQPSRRSAVRAAVKSVWVDVLGNASAIFPYTQPALFSMPIAFFADAWLFSTLDKARRPVKKPSRTQYVRPDRCRRPRPPHRTDARFPEPRRIQPPRAPAPGRFFRFRQCALFAAGSHAPGPSCKTRSAGRATPPVFVGASTPAAIGRCGRRCAAGPCRGRNRTDPRRSKILAAFLRHPSASWDAAACSAGNSRALPGRSGFPDSQTAHRFWFCLPAGPSSQRSSCLSNRLLVILLLITTPALTIRPDLARAAARKIKAAPDGRGKGISTPARARSGQSGTLLHRGADRPQRRRHSRRRSRRNRRFLPTSRSLRTVLHSRCSTPSPFVVSFVSSPRCSCFFADLMPKRSHGSSRTHRGGGDCNRCGCACGCSRRWCVGLQRRGQPHLPLRFRVAERAHRGHHRHDIMAMADAGARPARCCARATPDQQRVPDSRIVPSAIDLALRERSSHPVRSRRASGARSPPPARKFPVFGRHRP